MIMKKIRWPIILLVLNLAVISGIIVCFMNLNYPMVGHDYSGVTSMLETYLHFRLNGITIQWYAPNFGGGLPAFPNPNNAQFSLLQALVFFVSPWQSIILSTIFFIFLGGYVCYYFFKRILQLHWTSSILGTIFFSATGFYLQRMAVGHLGYQILPLFAVILVVLLDSSLPRGIAGLIFALVISIMIQQAGYLFIITFGLTLFILFPLLYIYRPEIVSWKRITVVIALGGFIALVISASKLAAVYAYMRFFPRLVADTYQTPGLLSGLIGIVCQLLGTMNLAPLLLVDKTHGELLVLIMQFFSRAPYGYWEFDMSMSPVVFGLLLAGVYSFVKRPKKYSGLFTAQKKWIAWIVLLFFTWMTVEFILAKGLMYPYLSKLPILSSLHVNPRYTVTFLFPLAMIAAIIYDKWISKWPARKVIRAFILMNVLTLIPLSTYFMIQDDLQSRVYNITESEKIYAAIRAGDTFDIIGIGDKSVDNTQALRLHLSNIAPYDPIFGYFDENLHSEIRPGSIWEISDGYYNMTNPSGYVFPEINNSRPFERIPVTEKAQLEAFASHRDPGWKIPLYQQILDWVSGLSAAGVFAFLTFFFAWKLVNRYINKRKATLNS
jgi:hypothetical protein